MKKYILLTLIGIAFLSCSNDDDANKDFSVLYNQTYCADPWGYAENSDALRDLINNYFKAENIEISNLKIDSKGTPEVCNACSCLSGKRFIVKVDQQDLDSIKAHGFQEY